MTEELREALGLLDDEQKKLDRWADESLAGGWSTHQVEPMRRRAAFIRERGDSLRVRALDL